MGVFKGVEPSVEILAGVPFFALCRTVENVVLQYVLVSKFPWLDLENA
jgi:hypothetical protein